MSRRRVKPEELALWRKVADTADQLNPDRPAAMPSLLVPQTKPDKPAAQPIPAFQVGERVSRGGAAHDTLPGLTDRMQAMPVTMDKRAYGKLKRGKLQPEARIDLHGMTVDRAHNALTGFVLRAHGQGKRLVLVITGKGKRADDDGPIPVR